MSDHETPHGASRGEPGPTQSRPGPEAGPTGPQEAAVAGSPTREEGAATGRPGPQEAAAPGPQEAAAPPAPAPGTGTGQSAPRPGTAWYEPAAPSGGFPDGPRPWTRPAWLRGRTALAGAAAGLVLAGGIGGFALGHLTAGHGARHAGPAGTGLSQSDDGHPHRRSAPGRPPADAGSGSTESTEPRSGRDGTGTVSGQASTGQS
ncbi:hypothetical protein GCM10010466_62410 [Planomonospora alba]|uniref:Uncharacterized protein n=1 Tax=Planomonospora alba TaxID=161354 RepID=A0ABP6P013_9ACTN